MKLRYKGLIEGGLTTSGGCSKCGKSRVVGKGHVAPVRVFYLLSGASVTLRVGSIAEFSDNDAMELLKYNSPTREVFEVVEV